MDVLASTEVISFAQTLQQHKLKLQRQKVQTLQVNIGKRCNQACHHCHVESGPDRIENMTLATIDRLIHLLAHSASITHVDITGGAPEMNPHFRYFVSAIRAMNKQVIDRCNLTILFEPGQENTAEFLADNQVQISASLPCYSSANVNAQRGKGVFAKSIRALQLLNNLGYGQQPPTSTEPLILNLVYNPLGASLPPDQMQLQADYKSRLANDFNIHFNQLFTITNMPIKRFAHQLQRDGHWQDYRQLLADNFNPATAKSVMCQDLISIGYDGQIYDCDFNQMLDIHHHRQAADIWKIGSFDDISSTIAIDDHCYACTAGAGSSCGGALSV